LNSYAMNIQTRDTVMRDDDRIKVITDETIINVAT
jgi:hypothetical protein